jgi:hypothetical protein
MELEVIPKGRGRPKSLKKDIEVNKDKVTLWDNPNKGGRPGKFSDELATRIMEVFKVGGSIEEACAYAGVSISTFNQWLTKKPYFADAVEGARMYPIIQARNIVVKKMVEEGDVKVAQWYLDRTAFKDRTRGNGEGGISMGGPSQVNIVFPDMVKDKYEEKQISKEPKKFRFDVSPSTEDNL